MLLNSLLFWRLLDDCYPEVDNDHNNVRRLLLNQGPLYVPFNLIKASFVDSEPGRPSDWEWLYSESKLNIEASLHHT